MKKRISPLGILLAVVSISLALIMLFPIIWALFCSLQHEGKQISTIWEWFTPPYTLQHSPDILK